MNYRVVSQSRQSEHNNHKGTIIDSVFKASGIQGNEYYRHKLNSKLSISNTCVDPHEGSAELCSE